MSADLFAEFNDQPQSPPATTPEPPFGQSSVQAQKQPAAGQDAFGLLQNTSSHGTGTFQPPQQWSTFSSQPTSLGGWGGNDPSPAPQASGSAAVEDDDDWGDFETSEPKAASPVAQTKATSQWAPPQQPIQWPQSQPATFPSEPRRTGIVRADTMELMTNSLVNFDDKPKPPPGPSIREELRSPPARPRLKQAPSDPNVLFDAGDFELEDGGLDYDDDEEDDDEFGDFETVTPAPSQPSAAVRPTAKPAPPSLDLLGLSIDEPSEPSRSEVTPSPQNNPSGLLSFGATAGAYPTAPKSPSYHQRNPFPELAVKTPLATEFVKEETQKSASPVTAWPSFEEKNTKPRDKYRDDEDEWGAWDDVPSEGANATAAIDATKAPENWDWSPDDTVKVAAAAAADDAPPPVNVPPPSVILGIFPDLFGSADKLFKPMAGQSASIKDRILSDPKAVDFLKGYLMLATTAAHVIAGRKQRWHRDKILAKSMSISAAGSKGMKLAGVDKTQSAREDREAADVVAVWKDNVGRLRSAVAAANTAGQASLKVPELGETLQVQTAKLAPTALKACIICGLKREERVSKVDHEVEDSFGEWWVDHWGHRACKNFWIEHEQKLRQR